MPSILNYVDEDYYNELNLGRNKIIDNYYLPNINFVDDNPDMTTFVINNYNKCCRAFNVIDITPENLSIIQRDFDIALETYQNIAERKSSDLFKLACDICIGYFDIPKNIKFVDEIDVMDDHLNFNQQTKYNVESQYIGERNMLKKALVNALSINAMSEILNYETELDTIDRGLYSALNKVIRFNLYCLFAYPFEFLDISNEHDFDFYLGDDYTKIFIDCFGFINQVQQMFKAVGCWLTNTNKNDAKLSPNDIRISFGLCQLLNSKSYSIASTLFKINRYSDIDCKKYIQDICKK